MAGWLTSERLSGTVTFLFTDIEGSTGLLKHLGRARYGELLADQQRLLREAFAAHRGEEIDTQGDSFFVAFRSASDAVAAAVAIQRALGEHTWPEQEEVRVRIGIHTGEAAAAGERYVGLSVHRAARIGGAAHGGQVLLSTSTRELVEDDLPEGVFLRDLGLHRLKDIDRPERISQVAAEGLRLAFPPLRGAAPATPSPVLRRRSLWAAILVGVIAAAVAIPLFALRRLGRFRGARRRRRELGWGDRSVERPPRRLRPGRSVADSVAFGEGSVWVTHTEGNSVSQVDPRTNTRVQTIQVGGGPAGVAVGAGFVWVANSLDGTLSQIDPRTEAVVQKIQVGNGPTDVAVGEDAVFVANSGDRTLMVIDPTSGVIKHAFPVPGGANRIAVGARAVWVTSESAGSVARIDPRTGTAQQINVGNGPTAIAVGPGAVWVANGPDGTVSRIDPRSNRVSSVVQVGTGLSALAVTRDGVWVSNERAGTVSEIDPAGREVVRTLKTGNRPAGIAVSTETLYVAVQSSGRAHRGGRLLVLQGNPDGPEATLIDPAFLLFDWFKLTLAYDGLLTYARVGGSDGARLVPDLAKAIPTPTDGGKTYTFELRRGVRYSTGALVQPADFRRAIERAFGGAGAPFANLVGAARCAKAPKRCNLSEGIVADPAANTVTFHLTSADPDFLAQLALPAAFAVPVNTPLNAQLPLPATGPYMIASYNQKRGIRFVRNPYFHEWSSLAQPGGFPNEIVFRFGGDPASQVRKIERGQADLVYEGPPPELVNEVSTRYASQTHVNPSLGTTFFIFNTRLPPFNDVRARQAVNYAIDRNRMIQLRGLPLRPTCQLLPPNVEGYRPYCPYTPNLTTARRLVAASGTKGQAVTVWTNAKGETSGAYLVSALQSLGYRARLKHVEDIFSATQDSRRHVQVGGLVTWLTDEGSAASVLFSSLTCGSFKPRTTFNQNSPEFCNPKIDAEIARARSLQTSDPQAASSLWTKVDRDITDQSPLLFLWNIGHIDLVSRRIGNYTYNPEYGVLLDQLWVR